MKKWFNLILLFVGFLHLGFALANSAPNVDAGLDQTVDQGDIVVFSGSFSDPDAGDSHTVTWDMGDGQVISGENLMPGHIYSQPGKYTITLSVSDNNGSIETDSLVLNVLETAKPVDVLKVAASFDHSLALRTDGTVLAWGSNSSGQLGDGTSIDRFYPALVLDENGSPIKNVVSVAAGLAHSMALLANGTLITWGAGRYNPVPVVNEEGAPISGVKAIAAEYSHSLALLEDGRVMAWGRNWSGRLGDGTTTTREHPVFVVDESGTPISDVKAIAAGNAHNLALLNNGTLLSWGENGRGQLGDGTTIDRYNPVPVVDSSGAPVQDITAIDAGIYHSLALSSDGSVLGWGENGEGELGDGTTTDHYTPVYVSDGQGGKVDDVEMIAAGYYSSYALRNGQILTWGRGYSGVLGNGSHSSTSIPEFVLDENRDPISDIKAVVAGPSHTLALGGDGRLLTWGLNSDGQLGDGTSSSISTPEAVLDRPLEGGQKLRIGGIQKVVGGHGHTIAIQSDGTVLAWGDNAYGQLGDGTNLSLFHPVDVVDDMGIPIADIRDIAASMHTLALKTDGTMLAWGKNHNGQLGDGTREDSAHPITVVDSNGATVSGVQSIAVGQSHNLALLDDGSVISWGLNSSGQLGNGTNGREGHPVAVTDENGVSITGIQSISAGDYHSLALRSDGMVYSWGDNWVGELGDYTDIGRYNPVLVLDESGNPVTGVQEISAGPDYNVAVKTDGTVLVWGSGSYIRQFGNGASFNLYYAAVVTDEHGTQIDNIQDIAAGSDFVLMHHADGTILAWGSNAQGALGTGTYSDYPVSVIGIDGNPFGGVASISAGYSYSLALLNNGEVWAWGSNQQGQLSNGKGPYNLARYSKDSYGDPIDLCLSNCINMVPLVEGGDPISIELGSPVIFSGTFSDSDTGDTHNIAWDFGDGFTASGELAPSHTYTKTGTFTATLAIQDNRGGFGSDTVTVTVVEPVPDNRPCHTNAVELIQTAYDSVRSEVSITTSGTINLLNSDSLSYEAPIIRFLPDFHSPIGSVLHAKASSVNCGL